MRPLPSYKNQILENARRIETLRQELDKAIRHRDDGPEARSRWHAACQAFYDHHGSLAFPGGVETARDRLRAGDPIAIAYALDFIEVRPFFFRSGYLYLDLLRVLRNCPLKEAQRKRYEQVRKAYLEQLHPIRSACGKCSVLRHALGPVNFS